MAFQDCIDAVAKAIGSDDEELIEQAFQKVADEVKRQKVIREGELAEDRLRRIGRDLATEEKRAKLIEKRNAAMNLKIRLTTVQYIKGQWKGDYVEGLKSVLAGSSKVRTGARDSAYAAQQTLRNKYLQGFAYDVEKAGHWKVFVNGALDDDIARALGQIGRPEPNLKGIRNEAIEIARIVRKYQESLRREANKAGADIRMRDDFIVSQNHDMFKIEKAGQDQWIKDVMPMLDPETFNGVKDVKTFMENVYQNLASGVHLSTTGGASPTGFKGGSNLAKRMSEGRLLHFKDDAWIEYNKKYGNGSLREILLHSMDNMAQNIGIMRTLGTNPESNLRSIIDELAQDLDKTGTVKEIRDFADNTQDRSALFNLFREVDGSVNIPGRVMWAKWLAAVRTIQSLSKLGGVVLSAIPDAGFVGSELHFQGVPFLSAHGAAFRRLATGKLSKEKKEIAKALAIFSDGMTGSITNRFSGGNDDFPGKLAGLTQVFFKWNGQNWWTDRSREAIGLMMSNNLALHKNKKLNNLPGQLGNLMRQYGIDDEIWDMFRKVKAVKADGENFVVPEMARDVPDEAIEAYLTKRDLKSTPKAIEAFRDDMERKFLTAFVDRSQAAVLQPDARTNAILNQGTQRGTALGEALRLVMQFKSFPVAVVQRVVGREIYGRGSDTLMQALRSGNGEMVGMAQLILTLTSMGYISMVAKDLFKGREPRYPDDAEEFGKIFAAAALQGGALGIYGDFFFGEFKNRYGGSFTTSLLGPTAGSVDQVADLMGRIIEGDDAAAKSFNTAVNHLPFQNLFYTRAALDYLILDRAKEALNPGHKRRMEQRLKREQDQELLF